MSGLWKIRCKLHIGLLLLFVVSHVAAVESTDEFPGRRLFPDVRYIELDDFFNVYRGKKVIVVDVRSKNEYNTLKIKDALSIPITSRYFIGELQKIRKKDSRPIVVYCNGRTCMKSYKAARKLIKADIGRIYAYDAGIMDFAKTYPKHAILLGKPLNSAKKLISKKHFERHLISPDKFDRRVADTTDILIDLRERVQREDGISYYIGRERRVTMDNTQKLDRYINKAKKENKALLVYDAAGKQVRWLQYYLEEKDLKNYYFMKGGITAYYKSILPTTRH